MMPTLPVRSRRVVAGVAVVLLAVLVQGATACVHGPRFAAVHALTDEIVAQRLRVASQARRAVDGVFKAALPGMSGVVLHATLDVVARAPAALSVSVRSFFEVPQQVLVADGETVTLYDASSGTPRFARGSASEQTLEHIFGLPLAPDDAVALLLGRAPLDVSPGRPPPRVRLVSIDDQQGTYTARIERAGRGAFVVTARVEDDVVVDAELWRGDGRPLLHARCRSFVTAEGVTFARHIELTAREPGVDGSVAALVWTAQQVAWNPTSLPDGAFSLVPPPGFVVEPL
jgi:hypothetical protein